MSDPKRGEGSAFTPIVVVALLLAAGVVLQRGFTGRGPIDGPIDGPHTPEPMPPVLVEGWVNGPGPTDADLRGKVVAVDFWATWCAPCLQAMPELAALHNRLRDEKDFVLIGLTSESVRGPTVGLEGLEATIGRIDGFDWPVGHGAAPVFQALGVRQIPTLVLFGRDGQSVWRGWSVDRLAAAIDAELAKRPAAP